MLRFRDSWPSVSGPALAFLPRLAEWLLAPGNFYVAPGLALRCEHRPAHEQRWEIFRGRLLDSSHTRQSATFEEWNLYLIEGGVASDEPLLSLKWDATGQRLHVVRAVLCHVWEGYDSGGGVILSRETTRWVRELAGTIELAQMRDAGELLDEMACRIHHAVVGASRLPLTSVETPLPAFSLGRLAYFPAASALPPHPQPLSPASGERGEEKALADWREVMRATTELPLTSGEQAKRLETLLHIVPADESGALADALASSDVLRLLSTMFNEVSLSPWTDLVERTLLLLVALERQGHVTATAVVDFEASLLLQVVRHLTAYDLVTFHHRGANYPDALLLDAVLKDYLRRIERQPESFLAADPSAHRRRRALRMAYLQRRSHEGLPVPDAPTSPGENMRVLPPPHVRVPEEQILNPQKRHRAVHVDDPLSAHVGPRAGEVLRRALDELARPEELVELGLALFLDRPLGVGKQPGEPDQTVLLSHRAVSRSVARRRLRFLAEQHVLPAGCESVLDALELQGVPLAEVGGQPRPGTVSVADARQVAGDFVFLRTTPATVAELWRQYDLSALGSFLPRLIVPAREGSLTLFDEAMRPMVQATPDASEGYVSRGGREMLRAGLRLSTGRVARPRA